MSTFIWILFFVFVVLSFIPVIRLEQVRDNHRYKVLWYLSLSVFAWSIFTTLKMVAVEYYFIYYFVILTYPLLFIISYLMFETFQTYMNKQTHHIIKKLAAAFFLIDFLVAITNPYHFLMTSIELSASTTLADFTFGTPGIFFYIHTAVCYIFLAIGFIRMLNHLRKKNFENDAFPFRMILISVLLGITLNILYIFVYRFQLDPTYLFVVLITFILYTIIYQRDFSINLISSSRQYLFNHMREMYIISDNHGHLIEVSKNLKEKFKLVDIEQSSMNNLLMKLEKKAVLYEDKNHLMKKEFQGNKIYLNIKTQEFKIGRFKKTGLLTLLYDETDDVNHIFEIEELRSHDLMTGLYNRNYLEENRDKFEESFPRMGAIILDLDGLKLYNDSLGHKAGDRLITNFSKIILSTSELSNEMIPIRLGGDEFLILVKDAHKSKLIKIIETIKEKTNKIERFETISFSSGYAVRETSTSHMSTMLKEADDMMYEEKASKTDYREELKSILQKEKEMTK